MFARKPALAPQGRAARRPLPPASSRSRRAPYEQGRLGRVAESAGLEPAHPFGFGGLAPRCIATLPTLRKSMHRVQCRRARTMDCAAGLWAETPCFFVNFHGPAIIAVRADPSRNWRRERGFEPAKDISALTRFQNERLRPLGHPSRNENPRKHLGCRGSVNLLTRVIASRSAVPPRFPGRS